jgi:cytoskeletal protein RodZ
MATVLQPPPPSPKQGLGCCLGKGCLILVFFFAFLALVFVVGGFLGLRTFTSTEPRELPQVATSEEQQQAVLQRWDSFENAVHERRATTETTAPSPQAESAPASTEASTNPTIELTAGDINQLISANRHARGKAVVSIENDVGHVAVSIPISKKVGFSGRYLNADFEVRAAPNGDLNQIQISASSQRGVKVPARLLNALLGAKSVHGWVDPYINQYRREYEVSSFKIMDNKVVLEASRPR